MNKTICWTSIICRIIYNVWATPFICAHVQKEKRFNELGNEVRNGTCGRIRKPFAVASYFLNIIHYIYIYMSNLCRILWLIMHKYPLVIWHSYWKRAIDSCFTSCKWWLFSIAMLIYQRACCLASFHLQWHSSWICYTGCTWGTCATQSPPGAAMDVAVSLFWRIHN